jgi:hypothetical protein
VSGSALARRPGTFGRLWAAMPLGMRVAAVVLVLAILAGAFAQWLSPYDFRATHLRERLLPTFVFDGGTTKYVLGTDNLGRDILSRLLHATQISTALAFCGTLIAGLLGSLLGFVAAHRRGWVDDVILLLVDAQASLPFILIALAVMLSSVRISGCSSLFSGSTAGRSSRDWRAGPCCQGIGLRLRSAQPRCLAVASLFAPRPAEHRQHPDRPVHLEPSGHGAARDHPELLRVRCTAAHDEPRADAWRRPQPPPVRTLDRALAGGRDYRGHLVGEPARRLAARHARSDLEKRRLRPPIPGEVGWDGGTYGPTSRGTSERLSISQSALSSSWGTWQ